jgi:fructose-specific component phosphotransferase system IIB-like protein
MFVPDPTFPILRYKEFDTLEKAEKYLKLHQSLYNSQVNGKKCSILDKDTDEVLRVHVFK